MNDKATKQKTHANYQVALKILLEKDGKFLFLKVGSFFDLPGGRIDADEHEVELEKILKREVREELGPTLKYRLGGPILQFRRHFKKKDLHVFIVVYKAIYLSGKIDLSNEHTGFVWIDPKQKNFKKDNFFSKKEFLPFKKYFEEYNGA